MSQDDIGRPLEKLRCAPAPLQSDASRLTAMGRVQRSLTDLSLVHEQLDRVPHRAADTRLPLFVAVVRSRPEVLEPWVLVQEGEPPAALFARIEQRRVPLQAFFRTLVSVKGRVLAVVNDGVLGDPRLADEAAAAIDRREADIVQFMCVRRGSTVEGALLASQWRLRRQIGPAMVNLQVGVAGSYSDVVASRDSRQREGIRRSRRKLDKSGGGAKIVRFPQDVDDPDTLLAALELVSSRGYQRGLRVGFERDEFHEDIARVGLREGWFRAWVVEIDGAACAYWTAFVFPDLWTLHETAFDERHAGLAPGAGLLCHVIEDACADASVSDVSFGLGDARYKRDWADQEWFSRDITFYRRNLKWTGFVWTQQAVTYSAESFRRRLGDDRVAKLRTWIRKRAASSASSDAAQPPTNGAGE